MNEIKDKYEIRDEMIQQFLSKKNEFEFISNEYFELELRKKFLMNIIYLNHYINRILYQGIFRGVINSDIGLHNLSSANDYLNRDIKSFVRKYNANHKKLQIELASLTAEK